MVHSTIESFLCSIKYKIKKKLYFKSNNYSYIMNYAFKMSFISLKKKATMIPYYYYVGSYIFIGWRRIKYYYYYPKSKIQNQIKKFGTHFSPLFKEKKLPPCNNCSNHVYIKFYCASNGKTTIFYFCKSMEFYLIKG
jgi:hypothetical protein